MDWDKDWENYEKAFSKLDQAEFEFLARPLSAYRDALLAHGFTRMEAMKLVEAHSKWIYDMAVEEFISGQKEEDLDIEFTPEDPEDNDDLDVDSDID